MSGQQRLANQTQFGGGTILSLPGKGCPCISLATLGDPRRTPCMTSPDTHSTRTEMATPRADRLTKPDARPLAGRDGFHHGAKLNRAGQAFPRSRGQPQRPTAHGGRYSGPRRTNSELDHSRRMFVRRSSCISSNPSDHRCSPTVMATRTGEAAYCVKPLRSGGALRAPETVC